MTASLSLATMRWLSDGRWNSGGKSRFDFRAAAEQVAVGAAAGTRCASRRFDERLSDSSHSLHMTGKRSVFIATSLDGFIARGDGSIDWLELANSTVPAGEDCGYARFFASVDALVMGRASFELVLGFAEWPYGDKPVYVLSSSLRQLPSGVPRSVSLLDMSPHEVVSVAAQAGHHHLYIDGGRTIQSFLAAGLISELTITVIPVLLGSGISLFGELPRDIPLRLLSAKATPFGFVQSHYAVENLD